MLINLTPEQETRLKSLAVARGISSVEEAAITILDEKLCELELSHDDLSWAKPYVKAAHMAVACGEYMTLDEHNTQMDRLFDPLKS